MAQMDDSEVSSRGYVYVLVNSSMPGLVKVGRTAKSPSDCAAELYAGTGVPSPFVVAFEQFFSDCVLAEKQLHAELQRRGFRLANIREFFNVPTHDVIRIILSMEGHAEATDIDDVDDEVSLADDSADAIAEELGKLLPIAYGGEDSDAVRAQERLVELIGDESFYERSGEDLVDRGMALENGTDGYLVDPEEASELYRAAIEAGSLVAYTCLARGFLAQADEASSSGKERQHDALRARAMQVLKEGAKAGNYYCWLELGKLFLDKKQIQNADISFRNFFGERRAGILLSVEGPPSHAIYGYVAACDDYISACMHARHPIEHIQDLKRIRTSLMCFDDEMIDYVRAREPAGGPMAQQYAQRKQWCQRYLFAQPPSLPVVAVLPYRSPSAASAREFPWQPRLENADPVGQPKKSWWSRTFA